MDYNKKQMTMTIHLHHLRNLLIHPQVHFHLIHNHLFLNHHNRNNNIINYSNMIVVRILMNHIHHH